MGVAELSTGSDNRAAHPLIPKLCVREKVREREGFPSGKLHKSSVYIILYMYMYNA